MIHVVCNPVFKCSKERVKSFMFRYGVLYMDRKMENFNRRHNHVDTIIFWHRQLCERDTYC